MNTSVQKDNSTFRQKLALRREVLRHAPDAPTILETHGGYGRIFERAWFKAHTGVVIEADAQKAEALARQRPTWRVYQGNNLPCLRAGIANDLAFDIVDLDPFGSSLDYLDALAQPGRTWPDRWQLVVNDGMRQTLRLGGAWHCGALRDVVERRGNNLDPVYLEVARELVEVMADALGFRLAGWVGYYTGANDCMTHYWATLERLATAGTAPGSASGRLVGGVVGAEVPGAL